MFNTKESRRMSRVASMWAVSAVVVMMSGCGDPDGPPPGAADDASILTGKLVLTGSSTVAPLASQIGKRFEKRHPGVRIDVQTGGSSRGISDALTGLADIGMSSRGLKDSEKDGRLQHNVAFDGVAFVVHASNPVGTLSDQQLLDIYTGKIDNWQVLGGQDAAITVINRADGRSELELVTDYFAVESKDIIADVIAGENQQCVKLVAGDPNAIAYLSVGAAEFENQRGTPLRLLPLRGIDATTATVSDGTFPLSRPLIFVTKPQVSPLAQAYIDFAQSGAVHDLVKELSFVPID